MNEVWQHYLEIMSDPAHLFAEISMMVLVDVFFLGLLWPLFRKMIDARINREHAILDAEHGIDHDAVSADVVDVTVSR